MRAVKVAVAVVAVLGGGSALATAQGTVPTVPISTDATSLTVPPTPIGPGATRFAITSTATEGDGIGVFVATPKPGRTVEEAVAAVRANPETSFEVIDVVASVALAPGASRAVTTTIEPGRSYMVVSDRGGQNPATWSISPLVTSGAPTGATAPRPDAEIRVRDLRFLGASTLPRRGTIRVRNVGWAPHIAIAFRLQPKAKKTAVANALLKNRQRAFGRLVDFPSTVDVSNVISRNAVEDQEVSFRKAGRYVLVCFVEDHNKQGMFRFVRVR